MEPFHNSASVLNPERSRFLCIFWLRMRFKYIKLKTAFVRGRSSMLMLTHPHTWSCQCVMQHDLYVVRVFPLPLQCQIHSRWDSTGYAPSLHYQGDFAQPLIPHFCAFFFPITSQSDSRELHVIPHQESEVSRGSVHTGKNLQPHTLSEV